MKALTFRLLLIVTVSLATIKAIPAECRSFGPRKLLNPSLPAPGSKELKPDQVNTAGWDKAWTNLVNDVEQSFRPSALRLVAVEVELIAGNVGEPQDNLTLSLKNAEGDDLVSITQTVKTPDCEHVLFLFPDGGVEVTRGDLYRIRLAVEQPLAGNMLLAAIQKEKRPSMASRSYAKRGAPFYSAHLEQIKTCQQTALTPMRSEAQALQEVSTRLLPQWFR